MVLHPMHRQETDMYNLDLVTTKPVSKKQKMCKVTAYIAVNIQLDK